MGFYANSGVTKSMIHQAIQRILVSKEVLIIIAQIPSADKHATGCTFRVDFLREIIQLANEYNIVYYTVRGLKKEAQ